MKVYIVAGEPSGDLLASGLMRALQRLIPEVKFRGVGGESMEAIDNSSIAGFTSEDSVCGEMDKSFKSLFDIAEISVMGIFEVLPRLRLILKRIRQTVSDIEAWQPDVLITVDSWGFASALLTRLRRKTLLFPVIHYVAPQVWAWKKGRAKNVAKLVDRLMTLLPNEGKWFEKYGLQSDFVGHPVVERVIEANVDPKGFRAANGILDDAVVVSVLPGSRRQEVRRLGLIFDKAAGILHDKWTVNEGLVGSSEVSKQRSDRAFFVIKPSSAGSLGERYSAFAASTIAIAKSGTVSLELAALGVPHLIAYKFGRLSNLVARLLVKVRFANLINILADNEIAENRGRNARADVETREEIIPEFLLWNCKPEPIADCALRLLNEPELAERQIVEASEVMQKLRLPCVLPSDRAAQVVVEVVSGYKPAMIEV